MSGWFRRLKKQTLKKLIMIDTGYHSHHLSTTLLERGGFSILAFIDEEPWNHLNLMNGAKIHYPSELLALAEKSRADAVIKLTGKGWQPASDCVSELQKKGIAYITLDVAIAPDEQLNIIVERLSAER
ncbi:hypothetical protein [Amphritea pacifica]|uniref:hypothetical protein n=1 Tax=Amphritea pacifica TaxID=2811233 RepID=UPI0019663F69|nr:hypothetical protein [Amphritea pacifica]MBN1008607.1 hypothetical protein [Amphritea pacifica]